MSIKVVGILFAAVVGLIFWGVILAGATVGLLEYFT